MSLGTPKGVLATHESFASAIRHQNEALGWTSDSRIFDFASYAFGTDTAGVLSGALSCKIDFLIFASPQPIHKRLLTHAFCRCGLGHFVTNALRRRLHMCSLGI